MQFELALRLPNAGTAAVLPLRLNISDGRFLVLDSKGGLAEFVDDWDAANDLAGVTGSIIHWYEGKGVGKSGRYGFETIILAPGRTNTNKSVWLTFAVFGMPLVEVTAMVDRTQVDHAMPLSGAEFVQGRCPLELKAIQELLVKDHPAVVEDEIRAHARWLNSGGAMKVGSRINLHGEDVDEEAVVFIYPDQSQMAVTASSIHVPPLTFSREQTKRILWSDFGHA